jgi:hypothetical protein
MQMDDMPGVFDVRTSVTENLLSIVELEMRGITPARVASSLSTRARGWVAIDDRRIVALAIVDLVAKSIFALFVLPDYEGRGLGTSARTSNGRIRG